MALMKKHIIIESLTYFAAACGILAVFNPAGAAETAALGDVITVKFDSLDSIAHDKEEITNAILFLNDFPMRGLHPVAPSYPSNSLRFELKRTVENRDQWRLLYKATEIWNPQLLPSVGFENDLKRVATAVSGSFTFQKVTSVVWVAIAVAIVVAVLLLLFIYGAKTNLLRDSTPIPEKQFKLKPIPLLKWLPGLNELRATGNDRPPFSLGRVQMAVWFVIIFISYIFLWLVLSERNSFNGTALSLLGIATATGLVSRGIDVGKRDNIRQLETEKSQLEARINELATMPQPLAPDLGAELITLKGRRDEILKKVSTATVPIADHATDGFLSDILSDENGISLQRLQMAGWTVVLALVFIGEVWNNLGMPDFDNTLLGLMGISSGVFLAFKVPEKGDVPN